MHRRTGPRTRRRGGAAAVELALLLPTVLVPILFGIWEVGRLVQVQQIVENASREGGRQGSVAKYTETQIKDSVKEYLTNAGLSVKDTAGLDNVTITVQMGPPPTGTASPTKIPYDPDTINQLDRVYIDVQFPFKNVRYLASNFFTQDTTLMNASSIWSCVKDLPVVVPTTIPQEPLK